MPKIEKSKKLSLPTKVKTKKKTVKPTKSTLIKPRPVHQKENTLAYFQCLVDQVANPLNEKVKITSMCHQCKHNKGKVQAVKDQKKQELLKKVAQNYLEFGRSVGRLIQADVVGCCKGLKK